MIQELGLTQEQIAQIRDADFAYRKKRLELKSQLDGWRLKMEQAFSDDIVDDAAVLSLAEKISNLRGKLFVQDIESRLALRKFLKADQIERLRLQSMHAKKRRPVRVSKRVAAKHSTENPDRDKGFKD